MTTTQELKPADITLRQLGGSRRLKAMINGRDFMSDNDGRTLVFTFSSCRKANRIRITLNALDLYDVDFIKVGRLNRKTFEVPVKTTGSVENVYAEDLRRVIEEFTGLYLSF
jgi:hypothetical protein